MTSDLGRRQLADDLRAAVAEGALQVWFQPQLRLASDSIAGAEALCRWHHRTFGPIQPTVFIPLAERDSLIADLERLVLNRACTLAAPWIAAGLIRRLSVNLSPRHAEMGSAVDDVVQALASSAMEASALELEITENHPALPHAGIWEKLRELGVSLALDDFGTCHSNLAYLGRLPVSALKIDQSFVAEIDVAGKGRAIVEAVIGLATAFGLRTVAEGVNRAEQLKTLRELKCDEVQGFLIGEPMPAEVFGRWLHERAGLT